MSTLQTFILAVVQGVTELLPISSSGHLSIVSEWLNINTDLFFITILHIGTTFSIIYGYRKTLIETLRSKYRWKFIINLFFATIPAVVAGLLLAEYIDAYLYSTSVVAVNLVFWGFVMIYIEKRSTRMPPKITSIKKVTTGNSIVVGLAQALALIPGTSRSAITTITGVVIGIEKYTALQFSFLMGLPVLFGSFVYEIFIKENGGVENLLTQQNLFGIVVAGITGIAAISIVRKYKKEKFLTFFGIYRIILGVVLLILL